MKLKVISGGQVGADIAGLFAAKEVGIKTGGYLPKGWKTLDGPRPQYAKLYGCKEHSSSNYSERTRANVEASDGTIRLALDFLSPGERCTLNAIKAFDKPYFDFDLKSTDRTYYILRLILWILENEISTLNVAGNANQKIENDITAILIPVFRIWKEQHEAGKGVYYFGKS